MNSAGRRAVAAIAFAALAANGCGSSHTSRSSARSASRTATITVTETLTATRTASAPASPASRTCLTSHLSLSFAGGQGAAGTAYLRYRFTNTGSTACTMIGYPGVAILDRLGRVVQHPATRGAFQPAPVRLVILGPGRAAQFLLNSTDTIPGPGCPHAYTGVMLQVIPPNQRTPIRQPYRGTFCDLRVGPVEPGG
jgi:hypothetical protein